MNVIQALNWRYAVREFSTAIIPRAQVQELLTATTLSASSYGLQPYRLIVVTSPEIKQQLLEFSLGQEKISQCSHLVIFAAQTDIGDVTVDRYINEVAKVRGVALDTLKNMSEHFKAALAVKTAEQKQTWAHEQAYIALGNFLTAAALMKIDACPMTGIETASFDKILGLAQKGLTVTAVSPIGIRHPADSYARLAKVRFSYDDMVTILE